MERFKKGASQEFASLTSLFSLLKAMEISFKNFESVTDACYLQKWLDIKKKYSNDVLEDLKAIN